MTRRSRSPRDDEDDAGETPLPTAPLRLDETLRAAGRALRAGFPTFAALALVAHVPYVALAIAWAHGARWDEDAVWTWLIADRAYGLAVAPLAAAAMIHAVFAGLAGRPPAIGASLRAAARRARPVLGVAFVALIALLCVALLTTAPAGWLASFLPLPGAARALVMVGLTALPALAVLTAFYMAAPAAVAEPIGASDAVARSWALGRGSMGTIIALVLVSVGPKLALDIGMALEGLSPGPAEDRETVTFLLFSSSALAGVVATLFTAVASATAYHLLRARREGVSAASLAAVFE